MTRATTILAATTVLGFSTSVYLYLDNRALRDHATPATEEIAAEVPTAPPDTPLSEPPADPWKEPAPETAAPTPPSLPPTPKETRMDRRARRTKEFAAMFGRLDGETDDEYRARIGPMIELGLAGPRKRVADMRRTAERKANVTAAQSKALDRAFDKVYDDVLDYTNKAIADGQLSPYERNVAGWLDYAGGLGGILTGANSEIGKILQPSQMKAMYDAGFEWGEYLGLNAPWENLQPPPPP